ncbi:ORF6N domain-containing protein [Puniceicoccales bacterium CK1056]|uniref:ORF6N domain-containing protein n=1 Tax=Oceanipulchritudo coccoides TaxID=2706888 RepID=A0A6B2M0B0_9BACT|nr:ORF6N domain-containing protein [Oceanipulchritudo coccoides]
MPKSAVRNIHDPIESVIFMVRGFRVVLDSDLAELYGVQTKVLNQALKRNIKKFPKDFLIKLSRN